MGSRENLGEFEQLALLAICRLGRDAYGTTIRELIETATGREIAIGALYTTLDRLQQKGFVESELGESTPERGGRAKRYFSMTPGGGVALRRSMDAISALASGLRSAGEWAI